MSKLKNMRGVEIPPFRAVSSGPRPVNEIFEGENSFFAWVRGHKDLLKSHLFEPMDFLWHEDMDISRSVWVLPVEDWVTERDTAPWG